ncbi:MAG: FprA family A-type flavoprotein [Clostridiaceae bacterium]
MLKSTKINNDVFWVGALDPGLRIFDIIMYTPFGTSYNSYAVKGTEKTAVFEAVKAPFFEEYCERLNDMGLDIKNVDYLVVNHTEPDHAGSIEKILKINPNIEVIGSKTALNFLKGITNMEFKSREAKEGDTLDLGGKTVRFLMTPFLHWPDTMVSYVEEDKFLITCDIFGTHYCFDGVFNDDLPADKKEEYLSSLRYYYDVIMSPFKQHLLKAIDKIEPLELDMILTGHGPVLRKDPREVIKLWKGWAQQEQKNKDTISINYVSAYGFTKEIAETVAEGIRSAGDFKVTLNDVIHCKTEDLVAEIGKADAVLFGSPTIVGELLEPIRILLAHLNPIIHGGKIAGAFGSYGWSGEAVPRIESRLKELKMKMPAGVIRFNFKMSEADKETAREYGRQIAEALKA